MYVDTHTWKGALSKISQADAQQHKAKIYKQKFV